MQVCLPEGVLIALICMVLGGFVLEFLAAIGCALTAEVFTLIAECLPMMLAEHGCCSFEKRLLLLAGAAIARLYSGSILPSAKLCPG